MIPLCLVTGFLGSGKTTLLERFADQYAGQRMVFLVNEFAGADVDGARVQQAGGQVVPVPGGSIFCRCLVTEFIHALKQIAGLGEELVLPPSGLLIEASGIADPRVIQTMLAETKLDQVYDLRSILTVIDPESYRKLRHTLTAVTVQAESADVILLNRIDLCTDAAVQETEDDLRQRNPSARILRCCRGEVHLDPFAPHGHDGLHGPYAPCADPGFYRLVLQADGLGVDALTRFLAGEGGPVYRIKGGIRHGEICYDVDGVHRTVTCRPTDATRPTQLVVIGAGAEHGADREQCWNQFIEKERNDASMGDRTSS